MAGRILVLDDERAIREELGDFLEGQGYEVRLAGDGAEAMQRLQAEPFDVLVCDLRLPDGNGLEVTRRALERDESLSVLVITAYPTVESAVEALRRGAADYVFKPLDFDDVRIRIERILRERRLREENRGLRRRLYGVEGFEAIVAESPAMRAVVEMARRVAATDANVLLVGESGTGKEVLARAIHGASGRREKPFLAFNCAAIPDTLLESELFGYVRGAFTGAVGNKKGLFEAAAGGTLFLDEVTEVPRALQAKLLRAIEEREVIPLGSTRPLRLDARILASTNRDPRDEVAQGRFREDLYYRLRVVEIRVPSLRERREDIPVLAQTFLRRHAGELGRQIEGIEEEALAAMLRYRWPGNVRELGNVVERAVILGRGPRLAAADLPCEVLEPAEAPPPVEGALREHVRECERRYIEQVLAAVGGSRRRAAEVLGISPPTLWRRLREAKATGPDGDPN